MKCLFNTNLQVINASSLTVCIVKLTERYLVGQDVKLVQIKSFCLFHRY